MIYWLLAITAILVVVEELRQSSDRKKRDR
jgi:hypothetical protein